MPTWLRSVPVAALLAASACKIPYPIATNAGWAEVPPSSSHAPLRAGATVSLVIGMPSNCRSIGLATGVGGVENQYEATDHTRYPEFRAQALIALRNAVGEAGGTHARVDAEVTFTEPTGVTHVLLRGAALICR